MAKYFLPAFFILFISFVQFLFNDFFYPLSALNLILIIAVFLIFNYDFNLSLLFGVGSTLILEIFSPYPFGFLLIATFFTIAFANFLFLSFFTGKSFLSLVVLGISSFISYNFLIEIFNFLNIGERIGRSFSGKFFANVFWQCILNLIILIAIYFASNLLVKKLRTAFFIKDEKLS